MPVVSAGTTLSYTENRSAEVIDATIDISDIDAWLANTIFQEANIPNFEKVVEEWELIRAKVY